MWVGSWLYQWPALWPWTGYFICRNLCLWVSRIGVFSLYHYLVVVQVTGDNMRFKWNCMGRYQHRTKRRATLELPGLCWWWLRTENRKTRRTCTKISEVVIPGRGIILFSRSLSISFQFHTVHTRCFCNKEKRWQSVHSARHSPTPTLGGSKEPHRPSQRAGAGLGKGWEASSPLPRPEPALVSEWGSWREVVENTDSGARPTYSPCDPSHEPSPLCASVSSSIK